MHPQTNETLLATHLTPAMEQYFQKKLPQESPTRLRVKIAELLKYLLLCHHVYGDIPFTTDIDDLWHLWILQTIQYQALINQLPTRKFIHHSSNDYKDETDPDTATPEEKITQQISYLASYVHNFGNFTKEAIEFWPMTQSLMRMMNLDLEGLNRYLVRLAMTNEKVCTRVMNLHAA